MIIFVTPKNKCSKWFMEMKDIYLRFMQDIKV